MAKQAQTKTQKEFTVGFFLKQWVEATIVAESLEDALAVGRKLTIDDVLSLHVDTNDSSIKVIQAYDPDFEI